MENETHPQIEAVAAQLAEEIAFTHDAIMAVHKFAGQGGDPKVQLDCMKAAARLMQAQAAAALSLQRLTGNAQSFTIIHEKRGFPEKPAAPANTPTPENLKTNAPPAPRRWTAAELEAMDQARLEPGEDSWGEEAM